MKISDRRRYTVLCIAQPAVRGAEQTVVGCTVQYIYGGRIFLCETGLQVYLVRDLWVKSVSNFVQVSKNVTKIIVKISKRHKPHLITTETASSPAHVIFRIVG
jgi:hypothetical protein